MGTKEKILLATLELASEQGLGSVSLSKIAKKVGVQKATLYSHFSSKEEIIDSLYEFLRDRAKQKVGAEQVDYGKLVKGKHPVQVLKMAVASYQTMNLNDEMMMFYKFVMSERVFNQEAAKIMVIETEKMILATKQLFYAMQIHGVMNFKNIDMAAVAFAMTIHSLMDYNGDKMVAEQETIGNLVEDYIEDFCEVYGNVQNIE